MNSTYESLRALLRNKELEIKKLEKEIEALRIVLPIVAEAGDAALESVPSFDAPRAASDSGKMKAATGPEFTAQAAAPATSPRPAAGVETGSKPRTSWP
jgi:hypothetical protein